MTLFPINSVLKECRKSCPKAQEELYKYTYEKIISTALRYTKSREESKWVFNMAMLKVYKNLDKFTIGTNYLGWANNILVKTCIDNYRSNSKHKQHIAPLDFHDDKKASHIVNNALSELEAEKIIELIQTLGENERIVFSLYEIEGYKHREIEDITGINMNTSKWLLSKAKKELRKKINRLYDLKMYVNE